MFKKIIKIYLSLISEMYYFLKYFFFFFYLIITSNSFQDVLTCEKWWRLDQLSFYRYVCPDVR